MTAPPKTPKVYIDLCDALDPDQFDLVIRAIDGVVQGSASLALDSAEDRAELIDRLGVALGAISMLHPEVNPGLLRGYQRMLDARKADRNKEAR